MTNRLRELRLKREKTQDAIAEELSIPRGSYSLLESGSFLPSKEMLQNLTRVFNCKDAEIYSDVYLGAIELESSDD